MSDIAEAKISIEVAYASESRQLIKVIEVVVGTKVIEAVAQSGIAEDFPELDLSALKLGIFSKSVQVDQVVVANDRVEIYRPLLIDPKEARRRRAKSRAGNKAD